MRDLPPDNQAQAAYISSPIKLQGPYTLKKVEPSNKICRCIIRVGRLIEGWSHLQCVRCKRPIMGICITYSGRIYKGEK